MADPATSRFDEATDVRVARVGPRGQPAPPHGGGSRLAQGNPASEKPGGGGIGPGSGRSMKTPAGRVPPTMTPQHAEVVDPESAQFTAKHSEFAFTFGDPWHWLPRLNPNTPPV